MDFQTLKANLGDWLGKDTESLPDSVRGLVVNMAIRGYLRILDLRFGEISTNLTALTASNDLPADFSRPYSMWYLQDGCKINVDFLTKEEFDVKYPDPSVADPYVLHYTIWGGKIYWGPVPSSSLSITFNYFGYLADLVANTDHNTFTDLAWEVIFFRALCLCTLYGIEDSRATTWQALATEQENKLVLEHSRKSAGRRPASRDFGYTG